MMLFFFFKKQTNLLEFFKREVPSWLTVEEREDRLPLE